MKLQEQLRRRIAMQGKSRSTYRTYWQWCHAFLRYMKAQRSQWVHPNDCTQADVTAWLSSLANDRQVAKNSQNVALQAVCYLYRELLDRPLENVAAIRAKKPKVVPDILSQDEVGQILSHMHGVPLLVCQLLYGCGLRIGDALQLRVKDFSFERSQITIHASKGDKWRYVGFPKCLHEPVRRQMQRVRTLHAYDAEQNPNGVSLPGAYRRKCKSAANQLAWYWLFPSDTLSRDDHGVLCRHHVHASTVSRALAAAVRSAKVHKRVTSHVFRHAFATHSHEGGVSLRALQTLLGHEDSKTTEIYTHIDQSGVTASKSPLEAVLRHPVQRSEPVKLRVYAG